MPKLINFGNEMIKINANGRDLESSTNKGKSFSHICGIQTNRDGVPLDLLEFGGEIIMLTSKQLMSSTNKGRSFSLICGLQSSYGEPQALSDGGKELLLITSTQLMYSTNKGRSFWFRKRL